MNVVIFILVVGAIVGCIAAGMGKCPLWVPVLLGLIALALVVLPSAGLRLG